MPSVWRTVCSVRDRMTWSKELVVEVGEALLQVALQITLMPLLDAGQDALGVVDLDAVAAHAARVGQVAQQPAVAAAEVEHAARRARSSWRSRRSRSVA